MRSPDFYSKLIAFFREWNYVKLSAFYRSERKWLDEEYIKKEDEYYGRKSKEELYGILFEEKYLDSLSILLHNPKLKTQWQVLRSTEFYEWVDKEIGPEFETIMTALTRGYLFEWIFFNSSSDKILSLLHNTPVNYNKWKSQFEEWELTRAEMQSIPSYKDGIHLFNILYRSVKEEEMLMVMFDGMNGGPLYRHKDSIINLLIDNDLLFEMQNVYAEKWNRYGRYNDWDANLLNLPDAGEEAIVYPPISGEMKKFAESFMPNYVRVNTRDKQLLVSVNKEELFHVIYKSLKDYPLAFANKKDLKLTKHVWHDVFCYLEKVKLLHWEQDPPYKKFCNAVVAYVHGKAAIDNIDKLKEIGKVSGEIKNPQQHQLKNEIMRKVKINIGAYLHSLEEKKK